MTDKEARTLRQLYAKIPSFLCIEGCTDCCGPVPWTDVELAEIGRSAPPPERSDKRCPFSLSGRCDIHDRRPLMCRLYGAVEDLRCPHGRGPLQLLTVEEGHAIVRRYKRMIPPEMRDQGQ
jgi:Fe-S-cluster containining protein